MWLDRFRPKIISTSPAAAAVLSSIKYYDTEGVESTLHDSNYYVDTQSQPAVSPSTTASPGQRQPCGPKRVCITFVCGYGTALKMCPLKSCMR
jgi:hypothetical protein